MGSQSAHLVHGDLTSIVVVSICRGRRSDALADPLTPLASGPDAIPTELRARHAEHISVVRTAVNTPGVNKHRSPAPSPNSMTFRRLAEDWMSSMLSGMPASGS